VARLKKEDVSRRLWAKDSTLWSAEAAKREEIRDRLGWLNVPEKMLEHAPEFRELAVHGRKYTDVVLLGMGGSSLCPDVMRNTFGSRGTAPKLRVLDTTGPRDHPRGPGRDQHRDTLFIVASIRRARTTCRISLISGDQVSSNGRKGKAGSQFAAITDPAPH
jgi:hypothetical protein